MIPQAKQERITLAFTRGASGCAQPPYRIELRAVNRGTTACAKIHKPAPCPQVGVAHAPIPNNTRSRAGGVRPGKTILGRTVRPRGLQSHRTRDGASRGGGRPTDWERVKWRRSSL